MPTEEFLDREINRKIPAPSEAELQAAYDANRAQLGNADLESVRPQLISYLRGQRSEQLYGALMNRLKMTNTVMKHADVNAPNLAPGTVLAAVNGQPIRLDAINERMKSYIYKMEMRIYSAQKQILDRRINDLLIRQNKAGNRSRDREVLRREQAAHYRRPGVNAPDHRELPGTTAAGETRGGVGGKVARRRESTNVIERA